MFAALVPRADSAHTEQREARTMAELTNLETKLAEVTGLAMAAKDATAKVSKLVDDPKRRIESLRSSRISAIAKIPRRSIRSFQNLPSFLKDKLPPIDGQISLDAAHALHCPPPFPQNASSSPRLHTVPSKQRQHTRS